MAVRRGDTSADMDFNGLTDAVTNLVGSLILLVVLVVAITKPKAMPAGDGGQVPVDVLIEQIEAVKEKVSDTEKDIGGMDDRLRKLEEDLQELRSRGKRCVENEVTGEMV